MEGKAGTTLPGDGHSMERQYKSWNPDDRPMTVIAALATLYGYRNVTK